MYDSYQCIEGERRSETTEDFGVQRVLEREIVIKNLQALRAFAAISVVTFHFSLIGPTGLPIHFGAFGVDLFFVLSGFIIAFSADRNAKHFLPHRLIRVLPPYWIATFIGFMLVVLSTDLGASLVWFGQSLFFIPGPHGRGAIIFVAWTLVYELAFYGVYWLSLRLSQRFAPFICGAALLFLVFGIQRTGLGIGPWPLLLEFVYGLGVYFVTKHVTTSSRWLTAACLALTVAALFALYYFDGQMHTGTGVDVDFRRIVVWGLPSAAMVLGLVLIERHGIATANRLVLLLGNASYAMYLLHPLVLGILLQYPAKPLSVTMWWFCGATLATAAVAVAFYLLIEAPVIYRLRRLMGDRGPAVQAAA